MTLRDALRRAADYGRRAAASVAQRPVTVTLRVESYSGAVGLTATTLVSTSDTTLDPSPKVVRLSAEDAAWFGGGAAAASAGLLSADVYRVGPVTKAYTGGGYTLAQLLPTGATTKRVLVVLAGDEFEAGGESFQVVDVDEHSHPQSLYLTVKRTRQ